MTPIEKAARDALIAAGWAEQATAVWTPQLGAREPRVKTDAIATEVQRLMGKRSKMWGVIIEELECCPICNGPWALEQGIYARQFCPNCGI